MLVGNDVVDLAQPYARTKADDRRFVGRVFGRDELIAIESAADPTRMLWFLWSAKEAAYKIARKIERDCPFSHRKFHVVFDGVCSLQPPCFGRVEYGAHCFPVRWDSDERFVHCMGVDADDDSCDDGLLSLAGAHRMNEMSRRSLDDGRRGSRGMFFSVMDVHGCAWESADESDRVRVMAADMISHLRGGDVEIVREQCAGVLCPPAAHVNGRPIDHLDISLSHDGDYVAAAVVQCSEELCT